MLSISYALIGVIIYYFVCLIILQAKPIIEIMYLAAFVVFTAGISDIVAAIGKLK